MSASSPKEPEVVIHRPPKIHIYLVTDDQLRRVEESASNVGNRFSVMLAAISAILSLAIAMIQGEFEKEVEIAFKAAIGVLGIVAIVMLCKWRHGRSLTSRLVSGIRVRQNNPNTSSEGAP